MRAKDQDITYTLENVRVITDNLNELTESLKERPWSLVRIRQPKDRKVPPLAGATMMKSLVRLSICALTLLIASCGGGARRPHYYALEIPPAPDRTLSGPRFTGTVAVCRFETPSYLRQGRIVYRESPEGVGFYDYHRWAADPAEVVTTAMIDALRSSRLFVIRKTI